MEYAIVYYVTARVTLTERSRIMEPTIADMLHAIVFAFDSDRVQTAEITIPRGSLNATYLAHVSPILTPDEAAKLESSIQESGALDQEGDLKCIDAHVFIPESESHRELMIVFEITFDPENDTATIKSATQEMN